MDVTFYLKSRKRQISTLVVLLVFKEPNPQAFKYQETNMNLQKQRPSLHMEQFQVQVIIHWSHLHHNNQHPISSKWRKRQSAVRYVAVTGGRQAHSISI